MNWLVVFIGGGIGSVLRYGIGQLWLGKQDTFPYSTLLANVTASILIAIFLVLPIRQNNPTMWLFLATGICGGLSTFSTFSLETIMLFREGHTQLGIVNVCLSILLCLGTVWFVAKNYADVN